MTWSVTVERDGEQVVTIETKCLSGRDLIPGDEDAIRTAAQHLLAFIGDGMTSEEVKTERAERRRQFRLEDRL